MEFRLKKSLIIVFLGGRQGKMLRVKGLDKNLPRAFSPPSPPGHLGQKLESALAGVILRKKEAEVRGHHSHESDLWKVVAFGDHLGADENIQPLFF